MLLHLSPKTLDSGRIEAFLCDASSSEEEKVFRRALLAKAGTYPLTLQYGLGMKAEYPEIEELLKEGVNVRHNVRLMGGTTLHPLTGDEARRDGVLALLEKEATSVYDAVVSALWKENVVVEFTGEGSLHLSSTYFSNHNELIVIHVRPGAKGTVIEEIQGKDNTVSARTIVAIVEKGGSLEYRSSLTPDTGGTLFLRQFGVVHESASLSWFDVSRGGGRIFSRTGSELVGAHATSNIYMTTVSGKDRHLDVEHRISHSASDTRSRIATAGVGSGTSRTIYRGDIAVAKGTVRTEGRQEGRFLVLEPSAKIDAVPALDIEAHDVKSSHALSVGYLSPTMLFYPRLRGVHAEDAVGFLVSGMMKKTLSRGGASEKDAYEMSRIGEVLDK